MLSDPEKTASLREQRFDFRFPVTVNSANGLKMGYLSVALRAREPIPKREPVTYYERRDNTNPEPSRRSQH